MWKVLFEKEFGEMRYELLMTLPFVPIPGLNIRIGERGELTFCIGHGICWVETLEMFVAVAVQPLFRLGEPNEPEEWVAQGFKLRK